MAKKNERTARHDIIVDMNDFLMDYASTKLGRHPGLAEKVAAAGQPDLKGLDQLFADNGVGRRTKYLEVATGFLRDEADIDEALAKDISGESEALAKEALTYLASHTQDFDRWEEA